MERRDPASGLIRLGVVLSHVHRRHQSGVLRVEDQGRTHLVRLFEGRIAGVRMEGASMPTPSSERPEQLFSLVRPRSIFKEQHTAPVFSETVSPDRVVLRGVVRRAEMFDPRPISERIPVDALQLDRNAMLRLSRLGLSEAEQKFVDALQVPTPVTMALWKRGLSPQHAAAMIVALNVMGCFPDWEPGDLPRIAAVGRLLRKIRSKALHHELLGISPDAGREEVDRAFRKLSFELHPDRLSWIPEKERREASAVFESISAAHAALKVSRRRSTVRDTQQASPGEVYRRKPWISCIEAAQKYAHAGLSKQAAAAALRALSFSPPPEIVAQIKSILRMSA